MHFPIFLYHPTKPKTYFPQESLYNNLPDKHLWRITPYEFQEIPPCLHCDNYKKEIDRLNAFILTLQAELISPSTSTPPLVLPPPLPPPLPHTSPASFHQDKRFKK